MSKTIKLRKHLGVLVVDNYFIIDNALIIRKDLIKMDNEILDSQLRNSELALFSITEGYLSYPQEKPCNWSGIVPTTPYDDNLPMFITNLLTRLCKTNYTMLRCDSVDKLELQGINTYWLENYLPSKNIYYSPSRKQFTIWDDNGLAALIMPCNISKTDIGTYISELNYLREFKRAQDLKQ